MIVTLRQLIRQMISEAPLAWGEDDEGNKKPSISVPETEEERMQVYDELMATEIGEYEESSFRGKTFKNPLTRHRSLDNFPLEELEGRKDFTEEEKEEIIKKDEEISRFYSELMIKAGNVKRVDKQFKNFPYDVHFVVLPQMVQGSDFYHDDGAAWFRGNFSLEWDNTFRYTSPGMKKTHLDTEASGFYERFGVIKKGSNPNFESFIKKYIKEKTGATVKENDIVFVNFLGFRYMPWETGFFDRKDNILNMTVEEIKKEISKKFYHLDSLRMIVHTLFDGGPFMGMTQQPPHEVVAFLAILGKYNLYLRSLTADYEFDASKALGVSRFEYSDQLQKEQEKLIKKEITPKSIADNSGVIKNNFKNQDSDVLSLIRVKTIRNGYINSGFDFYSELLTQAAIGRYFPIAVNQIDNLEISASDKEKLKELIPFMRDYIREGIRRVDLLSGQIIVGSTIDQRNYAA